jgi:hypothetical protein
LVIGDEKLKFLKFILDGGEQKYEMSSTSKIKHLTVKNISKGKEFHQ